MPILGPVNPPSADVTRILASLAPLPPPVDDIDQFWSPMEKLNASRMQRFAVVGSPETVRNGLEQFLELTGADELMTVSAIYDHAARVRSVEITAEVGRALGADMGVQAATA